MKYYTSEEIRKKAGCEKNKLQAFCCYMLAMVPAGLVDGFLENFEVRSRNLCFSGKNQIKEKEIIYLATFESIKPTTEKEGLLFMMSFGVPLLQEVARYHLMMIDPLFVNIEEEEQRLEKVIPKAEEGVLSKDDVLSLANSMLEEIKGEIEYELLKKVDEWMELYKPNLKDKWSNVRDEGIVDIRKE